MSFNEKCYQVALNLIPGIGHRLIKQLISYCGSASAVFTSNYKQLSRIPGIGIINANAVLSSNYLMKAEEIITKALEKDIRILFYLDEDFPSNLKQLIDAPTLLFKQGNSNLNVQKIIAIVGTRRATEYGKEVVETIVKDIAKYEPLIVSGLAYGIDFKAHKMALQHNIPTVAILAGGLDFIYPKLHTPVAKEMVAKGGSLLSEYPLGIHPDPRFFPARNRIIAGLADAVIVVEAAAKGGALITANIADSYNKDVFAVPGNINNTYSAGCNQLISKHKANIYTCIEDMEKQLGWDQIETQSNKIWQFDENLWSANELKLINTLKLYPKGIHIDRLSIESQISVNQVASLLLPMEFKGILKALPGKKFKLSYYQH